MKTICKITISAVVIVLAVACGNKTTANAQNTDTTAAKQATEVIEDGKTYDGAKFSLVYPKELNETWASDEIFNASIQDDEYCFLDATYNDFGPTTSELKTYAENWTYMKKMDNCKVDAPSINGKVLTIRSVSEEKGRTEIHFVVMKEDRICISGSLTFDSDKEAKYLPIAQSVIKSIKFK